MRSTTEEYYGAAKPERVFVNSLLGIDSDGGEQDWEIEVAQVDRIDEIVSLFRKEPMDLERKSALALLLVASVDEALDDDGVSLTSEQIQEARLAIASNDLVRRRMKHFWLDLGQARNKVAVGRIIE